VYVSLDGVETATLAAFFSSLAQNIALSIADQTGRRLPVPVMDVTNSRAFRDFLQASIAWLNCDLVFMVDHLEAVPTDLLRALLSALRAAYMEWHDDWHRSQGHLVAVVAGALSLATLTVGESSPFRNIATVVSMGDLTENESKALILAQTMTNGITISQAVRKRLLQVAGGNAHLIQLICRKCVQEAYEKGIRRLTTRRVNKVVHKFIEDQAAHYQHLQEAIRLIEEDPD
jgi:hypothetical protein